MRLLSPEHAATLTDPLTWTDNPFVRRDARRDRKKRQPLRSYAWMSFTLLLLGGLGCWGLWALTMHGFGNAWFLGADLSTALCVLICGLHVYFVIGASQKHTLRMLSDEVSHNTLSSLLLLPISAFQLVLQSMVYPWLVGMRASLMLLPLYVVCVALGGISWLDLLMLYVVFALAAATLPRWNRPILSEDVGLPATPTEANIFAQRAAATTPNMTGAANNNSGFGQFVSLGCFVFFFLIMNSRGNLAQVYDWVHRYAPDSIFVLLPSSLLSWPLLLARLLVTPFDWFGFHVIPLPFALLHFIGGRYAQVVRISEWLQVGRYRDLAALQTYLPRRRLEGLLQVGLAFVAAGYGWRWMVRDGELAGLVSVAGPTGAPGLPGFAYALIFVAAYMRGLSRAASLATWQRAALDPKGKPAVPILALIAGIRYAIEPLLFALLFYLACCGLGRVAPFPAGLLPMAGRALAIGAAGMLLRYGIGCISELASLLALLVLPLAIALHAYHGILNLDDHAIHNLAYASPLLGFIDVGNPSGIGFVSKMLYGLLTPALPWYRWVVVCGGGGSVLIVLSWLMSRVRRAAPLPEAVVLLDPTRVGREAFSDLPARQARDQSRSESPIAARLMAGIQRICDNAILTRDLRVRLRGKLQLQSLQRVILIFLCATLLVYYVLTAFTLLGLPVGKLVLSPPGTQDAETSAGLIGLWYLAALISAPFMGMAILPYLFAIEQEKSTLGFTLTTPMRPIAIALGKLSGQLIPNAINLVILGLWMLGVSLVFSPALGLVAVLRGWCLVMCTALALMITFASVALAVASIFPRRLTVKVGGMVQGLMVYTVIFGGQLIGFGMQRISAWTGLAGFGLWMLLIATACAICLLCILISVLAIRRLRKGDVLFTSSRREN